MTSRQKVVAVTGSSGHIGAKLLEHLEETPGLGKLVAFDLRPLRSPVHNIAVYRQDVSQPIHSHLTRHGVTTLVHLAFAWRSGLLRGEANAMSERNREMLSAVAESCRQASIKHLIYVSSHTTYGARPDLPVPVNEEWPRRPAPGFQYAQDNHRAEETLLEFAEANPDIKVTILRSCQSLGNMTSLALVRELYSPGWVGLSDHNPALQFVNDDDLARIIRLAILGELAGVYNVAGSGVVFIRELERALSSRRVQLPASMVFPLRRWIGESFVAYSHRLDRWPIILSTAKLRRETGYRFRHTALESLACFISYNDELLAQPQPKLASAR